MKSPYITGAVMESPVALVITEAGGRLNAMTVSYFSELAHYPTRLWISIAQASFTHGIIEQSGRFTLAVLHQKQKDIAISCGSVSGRDRDKCGALNIERSGDIFYPAGSVAATACKVAERFGIGDHTVFLADILEGQWESRSSHMRRLLISDF